MSQKENKIIRKFNNDPGRTIDYYANICTNDGGTNNTYISDEGLLTGGNVGSLPKVDMYYRGNVFYHYNDLFDMFDYENELATEELTSSPVIMQQIKIGENEIKEGRKVSWRDVYREG